MKIIILVTFFCQLAMSGVTQGKMNFSVEEKTLTITPQKGFHINEKAPAKLVLENKKEIKPVEKTQQKILFMQSEKAEKGISSFYVCDDANTVCEKHEQEIHFKNKSTATLKTVSAPGKIPLQAKDFKSNKPTLLVFSAPWCPSCIRMTTETFPNKDLQKILKKVKFKKLNIDLVENENLSQHFQVTAIPTTVLLNKNGEEIYRWLDYVPAGRFAQELTEELKNKDSIVELTKKADSGDVQSAEKLGKIFYGQMNWEAADKYLSKSKDSNAINLALSAKIQLLEGQKDESEAKTKSYLEALENGFRTTTSPIDRVRWKVDHLETKKDKQDKMLIMSVMTELENLKAEKNLEQLFSDSTYGDAAGLGLAEIYDMQARVHDIVGNKEEKNKAIQFSAELVLKQKLDIQQPGKIISAIQYLTQAEKMNEAEALIKKLIFANPKTYVYYNRYAHFLLKQKRLEEALVQINQALDFKEGNEPQLKTTKIKILKALNKKDAALDLIEDVLKQTLPHEEVYKRTRSNLIELKTELTK